MSKKPYYTGSNKGEDIALYGEVVVEIATKPFEMQFHATTPSKVGVTRQDMADIVHNSQDIEQLREMGDELLIRVDQLFLALNDTAKLSFALTRMLIDIAGADPMDIAKVAAAVQWMMTVDHKFLREYKDKKVIVDA